MNLRKALQILFLVLFSTGICSAQNWVLEWADEFDSTAIDTNKWSFQIGNGGPTLPGWGNNELQYYTDRPENARIEDSILIIEAIKESYASNFSYTSARIRTSGKVDFQFGKITARMKLPKGQGIWPAFWMLPEKVNASWPADGEIDIMELVGHEPNTSHGTIHYGTPWPNNQFKGCPYVLPNGDFSEDFHEFAIVWEPNSIKWYVDATLFCNLNQYSIAPYTWPFNSHPFYILLNLAVGGNWPGNPDGTTIFPQRLEVDYIRYFKDSSTSSNNLIQAEDKFSFKVYQDLQAQNLAIESGKKIQKVSLINMYGSTVREETPNSTRHLINTAGLSHGVYLLKASYEGTDKIQKVIF